MQTESCALGHLTIFSSASIEVSRVKVADKNLWHYFMSSRKRLPGKSADEDCKILVNSSEINASFGSKGADQLEYNLSLPEDRYGAIEEIRNLLGFSKTEWRVLLHAISKTDNGWLQFEFGSVTVDFKKFVDADQLHLRIDVGKNPKSKQSVKYIYDLTDFMRPKF